MKSLTEALATLQHIIEAEKKKIDPTKARDEVKSLANNDDTADDVINSMWSAASSELKKAWLDMCTEKKYNETQGKELLRVLIEHDLMDLVAACCNDNGIVEADALLKKEGRFKLGAFLDQKILDEYKITPSAMGSIISCQPANGSVAVGPGEMFLTCIIKNAKQNGGAAKDKNDGIDAPEEITGDIMIGEMGIEIKGSDAAFVGQKNKPSHSTLKTNLKKLPKDCYYVKSGVKEWRSVWPKLLEYCENDPAAIAKTILTGVYESSEGFSDYLEVLRNEKNNCTNFDNFMFATAAYSLYMYNNTEPFDSILFIQSQKSQRNNPTALIIRTKGLSIQNLFNNIKDNFNVASCFDYNNDRRIMPKINLKSL